MITSVCDKPRRQAGMATLGATVILLVLVSAIALYTSRTVLFEQRISGNDFRSRQAFEAAESGLSIALAYIGSNGGEDKDSNGVIDPVFDTNANGIGDTNTANFTDGSSVTVTVTGAFPAFNVVSVGLSNDRTASRTVRSTGSTGDALPNTPDNPLTARGNVVIAGAATVFNPEGNSTIWSGAGVDLGSNNAAHTEIADPTDPGYPTCMDTAMTCDTTTSSNRTGVGLDVIEHDTSLSNLTAEETFENFFGMSMENYRESRVTLEVAAANVGNLASATTNPGIQLAAGQVVWVEGNTTFSNNTTSGCTVVVVGNNFCPVANQDPSIIIIHGDLTANGTPNITGLLFVTGNFYLTGNMTNMGAIVVAGDFSNGSSGSLDVWYNSDVLDGTRDNGPLTGAPGSWRDW
jgi:hypothetical protein